MIQTSSIRFEPLTETALLDEHARPAKRLVLDQLMATARKKRKLILFAQIRNTDDGLQFLTLNDARGGRRWIRLGSTDESVSTIKDALATLSDFEKKEIVIIPSGAVVEPLRRLVKEHRSQRMVNHNGGSVAIALEIYSHGQVEILLTANTNHRPTKTPSAEQSDVVSQECDSRGVLIQ